MITFKIIKGIKFSLILFITLISSYRLVVNITLYSNIFNIIEIKVIASISLI